MPLHDVEAVWYRHEVLRDLENGAVLASVNRFGEAMRQMRQHLGQAQKLHYQLQQQAWFLDAVDIYCTAVRALTGELAACAVTSRGFRRFRRYLADYADSERFTALATQTRALKDALARVRYAVRVHGARVTVSRYADEPDYGAEVEETFAKFRQGTVRSYLVKLAEHAACPARHLPGMRAAGGDTHQPAAARAAPARHPRRRPGTAHPGGRLLPTAHLAVRVHRFSPRHLCRLREAGDRRRGRSGVTGPGEQGTRRPRACRRDPLSRAGGVRPVPGAGHLRT
jgi:hypothetical protein